MQMRETNILSTGDALTKPLIQQFIAYVMQPDTTYPISFGLPIELIICETQEGVPGIIGTYKGGDVFFLKTDAGFYRSDVVQDIGDVVQDIEVKARIPFDVKEFYQCLPDVLARIDSSNQD